MVQSKFIIEDGNLIMAKCVFHKQLAKNKENVKGGGSFMWDSEKKAFVFSGSSHDFGRAELEDIKECVKNNRVYRSSSLSFKMEEKFFYDTGTELIELN